MPAPKKNQHAAKNKGYDDRINVQAVLAEKIKFKAHAKSQGKTFTDWLNGALRDQYGLEKDSDDDE